MKDILKKIIKKQIEHIPATVIAIFKSAHQLRITEKEEKKNRYCFVKIQNHKEKVNKVERHNFCK